MHGSEPGDAPPPETLEELYDEAPCGYLTTTAAGIIVRVNGTLARMLGQEREKLLGQSIQVILTAGSRMFYHTHCAPMLALHGSLTEVSIDLASCHGGTVPALVNWRSVTDAQGRLLGYRVMVVGAAERVAYERELLAERERARQQEALVREMNADLERRVEARTAELAHLQKMESLGQLTGGVAHDFNNLLTPILITLDLLKTRYLSDDRAVRMAGSAISAAERARVLISRLLAFARRQNLHAERTDISGLVQGMMALITQAAGDAVRVEAAIAGDLPPTLVDQNQLEMALLNLCVNARDAMPDGGTLLITADSVVVDAPGEELAAGSFVRIAVSDTGQGMSADTLRRAAEPFYTTKSVGKGTGLGLSMVHGLAAQSGGRLVLASTPGHGTTATIWLPAEERSATPALAAAPGAEEPTLRPLSVLLVDDDELARVATAEMLIDLGHSVVEAASGDEALVALSENPPFDLLVTDYLMPGMTGAELIRIARMTSPSLPAMMISGYMDNRAFDGSGIPRLAKPYSAAELSRSIAATMASARATPRRIEAA